MLNSDSVFSNFSFWTLTKVHRKFFRHPRLSKTLLICCFKFHLALCFKKWKNIYIMCHFLILGALQIQYQVNDYLLWYVYYRMKNKANVSKNAVKNVPYLTYFSYYVCQINQWENDRWLNDGLWYHLQSHTPFIREIILIQ